MMYQVNSEEKILILKKKTEHYVHLDNYVLGTGASLLLSKDINYRNDSEVGLTGHER